jgi:hypothetical protein
MAVQATSIVTLVVALLLAPAITATAAPGWVTYTHPQLGFSLSYPDSWEATNPAPFDFRMRTPSAGVPGTYLNVIVAHDNVPKDIPLETYFTITGQGQAATPQVSEYVQLRTDRVMLGLFPALLRHLTYSMNGTGFRTLQLLLVDGTRGFRVQGMTRTASTTLEEDVSVLTGILMTFRPR